MTSPIRGREVLSGALARECPHSAEGHPGSHPRHLGFTAEGLAGGRASSPRLLVASHIKLWRDFPTDRLNPRNGLCLSSLHDAAFDSGSDEVSSQLAELEARELAQIERAVARLKQGNFGVCEGCQKKIAIARLNALPGVGLASATCCVPLEGGYGLPFLVMGRPLTDGPFHGGGGWLRILGM